MPDGSGRPCVPFFRPRRARVATLCNARWSRTRPFPNGFILHARSILLPLSGFHFVQCLHKPRRFFSHAYGMAESSSCPIAPKMGQGHIVEAISEAVKMNPSQGLNQSRGRGMRF